MRNVKLGFLLLNCLQQLMHRTCIGAAGSSPVEILERVLNAILRSLVPTAEPVSAVVESNERSGILQNGREV